MGGRGCPGQGVLIGTNLFAKSKRGLRRPHLPTVGYAALRVAFPPYGLAGGGEGPFLPTVGYAALRAAFPPYGLAGGGEGLFLPTVGYAALRAAFPPYGPELRERPGCVGWESNAQRRVSHRRQ
jgi:hypothetical protein